MSDLVIENKLCPAARENQPNSEIRYRRLFEFAVDGILVFDLATGKIIDVNPSMARLLARPRCEFIGKELREIGLLEKEVCSEALKKLRDEDFVRYECLPLKTSEGECRAIEFVGSAYEEGDNRAVQCSVRDITGRKLAEREKSELAAQIEHQRRRLVDIVANVPGIVWESSGEPDSAAPRIDFVSAYVETMLGYTVEEWLATPDFWLSVVHPEDKESAIRRATEIFASRQAGTNSFRWIAKDGRVVRVETQSVAVCDDTGKPIGMRGAAMDVSERRQAEEALAQSEAQIRQSQRLEAVGRWAGGIAHDFNNMLTVINGYSELTLRRLKKDGTLRANIEEIKKAGERSALLTHQLLAFSRQQALKTEVIDLNRVISETSSMLRRLISKDIRLVARLSPDPSLVGADAGQLSHVIINLVANARDAMPQGGVLTIETSNFTVSDEFEELTGQPVKFGSYVELRVGDTGLGMNAETQRHIFEPFYSNKDVGLGTGLGLAMVRDIVKQSGGYIFVGSAVGKGSTFKIYLPRVDEKVDAPENEKAFEQSPKGNETILIADAEDSVRALTRRVLEEGGYRVIEARNGIEALSIFERRDCKIDLLLADAVMPQMGGHELAEKLAPTRPTMPVLFMSGYSDDASVRRETSEFGANFIEKPFTPDLLARKVRELLDVSDAAAHS